jgi:hypothetical protein
MNPNNARSNIKGLKWDKNNGTKGYLLVVDDAGVVGVLRRDVRHWFI